MCSDISYKQTIFPNILGHKTQEQAALEMSQFFPLLKVQCSPYLKYFLCSTYVPSCSPLHSSGLPPCRQLCERARDGCLPILHNFGMLWPEQFNCSNFPNDGGSQCFQGPYIPTPTERPPPGMRISRLFSGFVCLFVFIVSLGANVNSRRK